MPLLAEQVCRAGKESHSVRSKRSLSLVNQPLNENPDRPGKDYYQEDDALIAHGIDGNVAFNGVLDSLDLLRGNNIDSDADEQINHCQDSEEATHGVTTPIT